MLQFGLTWNGNNKEELDLTTSAVFSESPPPAAWLYLSALHELPVWLRTRRLFPLSHFPFSEIGGGGSPLATLCPSCLGLPALWDKVCLTALLNTFKLHRRQFLKLIGPHHQSSGRKRSESPCTEISGSLAVSPPAPASTSSTSLPEPLAHRPSCHKPVLPCHSLCNPYSSWTPPFPMHPLGDPAQTRSIYPSTCSWQSNNIISVHSK